MAAFVSGLLQGGTAQASKNKDKDKKKKEQPEYEVMKKRKVQEIDMPGGKKLADPVSFKRGGRVRRGGMAKVHKGERVLTKRQTQKFKSKKR